MMRLFGRSCFKSPDYPEASALKDGYKDFYSHMLTNVWTVMKKGYIRDTKRLSVLVDKANGAMESVLRLPFFSN